LHTLFPKEAIKVISGQESTRTVHQLSLPDMTLHKDNWDSIAAHKNKLSMDFKVLAKHAKTSAKVFATKADRLSNIITSDEETLINDSPTTWRSMATVTSLLRIIAIALSIFTFCRTRQAMALLPSIDALPLVKANVIITNNTHRFAFEDTLATMTPMVKHVKIQLDIDTVILYIILPCSIVSFLYLTHKLMAKSVAYCRMSSCTTQKSQILFELSDGKHSVLLHILTIASVPSNIFMATNPCCPGMGITSTFRGLKKWLNIDWDSCKIMQANNKATVPLPQTINVPFMTGAKLQSILNTEYTAKLFISYNSLLRAMPIKPKSVSFSKDMVCQMTDKGTERRALLPSQETVNNLYPTCPPLSDLNYV
jgi:hypothetical protein